jgi:Ser/Thr protein kinase RdoA (MazF antagonist)
MNDNPWGSKETEFFYSLTPDKILDAVEELGFKVTGRALALNSLENRVYEIEIENDKAEEKADTFVIAKFYRPGRWNIEQILEEHSFLLELSNQDIPVVTPILYEDKSLFTLKEGSIFYALFKKCSGRNLAEIPDENLEQVGRLIGRMHSVGASKVFKHRIELNTKNYGFNHINFLENENLIDINIKTQYLEVANQICKITEELLSKFKAHRIHGDAHIGNLLSGREGFFWVDFDDSLTGPPVQDLWLLAPGRDDEAKFLRDKLLTGYEQFNTFDNASLKLIEPLRALRMIHFSAWIGKRFEDPSFKKVFPDYGSYNYWNDQFRALEEILRLIS